MAKGAGKPCVKCYVAFAATVVIVLTATGVWNPFPGFWEWVNSGQALSTPAVAWQERLGGTPKSVTIAGDAVVAEHRTTVEARGLSTGVRLWERDADWAAVAGDGANSVVVVGELLVKGYDVVDPVSGTVRRHDGEAVAVWTYRNALLDVRCAGAQDCTLTAWEPRSAAPLWRVPLPGVGFVLFADNPDVRGTRSLTAKRINGDAAGPVQMPQLIGFPVDGRVHVVDTSAGAVVQDLEPDRKDRVVVTGGRVLHIQAESRDGSCYFTVVGLEAGTGREVWRQAGLNLRTAEGGGCAQRKDPYGQESVILAVAADGRELVIDANDGRMLWLGTAGQRVVALNNRHALVRSPDGKTILCFELGLGRAVWSRRVDPDATAALSPYAAVISDRKPDRVIALNLRTGAELLVLRTSAHVAAVGPGGLVIVAGRDIGYARFSVTAGGVPPGGAPPARGPGAAPGGQPDPAYPTCGGPKQQSCERGKDD